MMETTYTCAYFEFLRPWPHLNTHGLNQGQVQLVQTLVYFHTALPGYSACVEGAAVSLWMNWEDPGDTI